MRLTVNGDIMEMENGATVGRLLETLHSGVARVAVLVNDTVLKPEERGRYVLSDGDRIEILNFAGGG